jgi:hypothetical protein
VPQLLKTWLVLSTFLATLVFPAWARTNHREYSQFVVSVYDSVGISSAVLAEAEREAAKIFKPAGVNVLWMNCPTAATSDPDSGVLIPPDCGLVEWPTHLALRIVPRSNRFTNEVFGVAFLSAEGVGCYSDVFYDHATGLRAGSNVSVTNILGNVIAHELGHLLLGSNSHAPSGIMKARWEGEELDRVAKEGLSFTAEQAEHIRERLITSEPPVAVTALASY